MRSYFEKCYFYHLILLFICFVYYIYFFKIIFFNCLEKYFCCVRGICLITEKCTFFLFSSSEEL